MATRLIPFLFLAILAGCAPTGLLYTGVVTPYTSSFDAAKIGTRKCDITEHKIKEPVTGTGIRIEWTWGKIQEEARTAGIREISYIDRKTQSFLFGIYKRETLVVHGE